MRTVRIDSGGGLPSDRLGDGRLISGCRDRPITVDILGAEVAHEPGVAEAEFARVWIGHKVRFGTEDAVGRDALNEIVAWGAHTMPGKRSVGGIGPWTMGTLDAVGGWALCVSVSP